MTQPYVKSELQAGSRGEWSIHRVLLPHRDHAVPDERPDCFRYRPGSYTELRKGGITYMTDLYDEWWTQLPAIERARASGGRILITGLGLGMVVREILCNPSRRSDVQEVVVIENAAEVIELVAPSLVAEFGALVRVIEADAFSWSPPIAGRFDVVWHDIWPDPNAAAVDEEMNRLREHHAPWSAWQGFWPQTYREALSQPNFPQ